MNALIYMVLGALIAFGILKGWDAVWSFRAQKSDDYALTEPGRPLADILGRRFEAHGVIYDYTGRVKSRFTAEISGAFDETGGVLNEQFAYSSGVTDQRRWTIRFGDDGAKFTATADDVIGDAIGERRGDAIRMTYKLRLPERAGGHVLDVVDWLYLLEDGAIVNRSDMRKFGFKAAEMIAVFRPAPAPKP